MKNKAYSYGLKGHCLSYGGSKTRLFDLSNERLGPCQWVLQSIKAGASFPKFMKFTKGGIQFGALVPVVLSSLVLIFLIVAPASATKAALTAFGISVLSYFMNRQHHVPTDQPRDAKVSSSQGERQTFLDNTNKELLAMKEEVSRSAHLLKIENSEKVCPVLHF